MRQDVEEEVGATVELEHHGPGETDVDRVREQSGHDIDARDAQQHELDGDPGIVRPHAHGEEPVRVLLVVVDEVVFGELAAELPIAEGLEHLRVRPRPDPGHHGHGEEGERHDGEIPAQSVQRQRQADDEEPRQPRQSPAGHGGQVVAGAVDDGGQACGFERVGGHGHDSRQVLRSGTVEVEEPSRLLRAQGVLLRQA